MLLIGWLTASGGCASAGSGAFSAPGTVLLAPRIKVQHATLGQRWSLPIDTRVAVAGSADAESLEAARQGLQRRFRRVNTLEAHVAPAPGPNELGPSALLVQAAAQRADVLVYVHYAVSLGRREVPLKLRRWNVDVPVPGVDRAKAQVLLIDLRRETTLRRAEVRLRTAAGRRLSPDLVAEAFGRFAASL